MYEASAIYEPMLPMGWIGDVPTDHRLALQTGMAVPKHWHKVVVDRSLSCGIAMKVERRGFAVYDFTRWQPGVARPAQRGDSSLVGRTLADSSRVAKPALVQRLRVVNSHLTLLHAAARKLQGESPPVVRVHERDLFRYDYADDTGEGYWYRPHGDILPSRTTAAERQRSGALEAATFEISLDWLNRIVIDDALLEFDLLNQAQAALGTHDYALAVVAGWTICELRIHSLGYGLPGVKEKTPVYDVCTKLEAHGQLSAGLKQRLDDVRRARNKWLHSGTEPAELVALEALRLATELLRHFVPDVSIKARSRLLIL